MKKILLFLLSWLMMFSMIPNVYGDESLIDLSGASVTLDTTSYTYTGSEIEPVASVIVDEVELVENESYTIAYSDNINVGTATITINGMGDYTGTVTANFTITARSISDATITLSQTSYTYNGSERKPSVTSVVVDGITLSSSNYSVSYSSDLITPGTKTVTIAGSGNYTDSASTTYIVNKRTISSAKLAYTNVAYTGYSRKPKVIVKYGSTVISSSNYTVTYSNNKSVGKATVKITGSGSYYTGTITKTFYIVPKKPTISSCKSSAKKKITIKWKKATGSSGYQIAYRKYGSSTWKYKTVSSSTRSKTLTSLTSKKYYYVKVRGYKKISSSTTKYGRWSVTKKVKVK